MKFRDMQVKMSVAEVRSVLESHFIFPTFERRLPNDTGTQLVLDTGAIVNVFDSRTVNVQGTNRTQVETALINGVGQFRGSLAALLAEQ